MIFLYCYLCIGIGFYLGLSLNNPMSFLDADAAGLIRGFILAVPFWPIGVIIKLIQILA